MPPLFLLSTIYKELWEVKGGENSSEAWILEQNSELIRKCCHFSIRYGKICWTLILSGVTAIFLTNKTKILKKEKKKTSVFDRGNYVALLCDT